MTGCKYYSYAGPYRGLKEADEKVFEKPGGGECPVALCDGNCDHRALLWDGNGYSETRAWISADVEHIIDLEDAR